MHSTAEELARYQRQMTIDGWGEAAQRALGASTVFVAGLGGLGSPVSMYLALAGVGRLVVCDYDRVELSNLNRQLLHDESCIGVSKVASARATLSRLNPGIEIVAVDTFITEEGVDQLVGGSHLIVDCMDSFETRYVLNDAAIRNGIPLVHGSVWGLEGRLSFINVPKTACLRCIFPAASPADLVPVLGATPGVIGTLQAMETLKYLAKVGTNLEGRLLVWDGGSMEFQNLRTVRDPACPSCGAGSAARNSR